MFVLALVTAQNGCEPGAWNDQPDFDAFLDTIEDACPQRIGRARISTLETNGPSFLDTTSRLYYGKIDAAAYHQSITAFHNSSAETNRRSTASFLTCPVRHHPHPVCSPVQGVDSRMPRLRRPAI